MASVSTNGKGFRRLSFSSVEGKPQMTYLGKTPMKVCETIKTRVELLLVAKASNSTIDLETAKWLTSIAPTLRSKLAAKGLCEPQAEESKADAGTLQTFIETYITRRTDVGPRTIRNYRQSLNAIVAFFKADRLVASINAAEAKDFERHLKTAAARKVKSSTAEKDEGLGKNTYRRFLRDAKQFWKDGVERGLLQTNPFQGLKTVVGGDRSRDFHITGEMAAAVLEKCPDHEWRLLFALGRYGGLRIPCEIENLTWDDMLWDKGLFMVRSPKTKQHDGKEFRLVPMFEELRPHIDMAYQLAPEGEIYLLPNLRLQVNTRTMLAKIINRAGLKPWPKLWQNLRSSRATELRETFPAHVTTDWLGHSEAIAQKYYLQVTQEHIDKATGKTTRPTPETIGIHHPPRK